MKNLYSISHNKYKKYLSYERKKLSNKSLRINFRLRQYLLNKNIFFPKSRKNYIYQLFLYSKNKKVLFKYFENR